MKHLLLVAAVVAAAPAAMASKARVEALGNSRQIVDFQTAFDRPYQFLQIAEQATIEWGANGDGEADAVAGTITGGTPHAEGGFVKRHGDDQAYGVYFGRRSAEFTEVVNGVRVQNAAFEGLLLEQNSINAFYAGKVAGFTWGATVKYSNGKDDAAGSKSNSAGIALGITNGTWEVEVTQGLTAKSENAAATVESKGLTKVGAAYNMNENMQIYANVGMIKVDGTLGGTDATLLDGTSYSLGMVNTVLRNEEANFFYGVAVSQTKLKDDSETLALPVWMGVEANAASWLVLRASIAQNVLLNETKEDATGDKTDLDSTTFAAGAGIKFGKSMIDASFTGSQTGVINADNMFSQVAYTYTF